MRLSPENEEPTYRATLIDKRGVVVSTVRLVAIDDNEACEKAKALVDGHSIDLWDGTRFIDHFMAPEPAE